MVVYGPLTQQLGEPDRSMVERRRGRMLYARVLKNGNGSGARTKPPQDTIYQVVVYGQAQCPARPGQCAEDLEPRGDVMAYATRSPFVLKEADARSSCHWHCH